MWRWVRWLWTRYKWWGPQTAKAATGSPPGPPAPLLRRLKAPADSRQGERRLLRFAAELMLDKVITLPRKARRYTARNYAAAAYRERHGLPVITGTTGGKTMRWDKFSYNRELVTWLTKAIKPLVRQAP